MIKVYTDGGARGNPGLGAIGVFIVDNNNKKLAGFGEKIGKTTNNVAEYKAVIRAFSWILDNREVLKHHETISVFVDSELIYSQIIGVYRVKKPHLATLFLKVKELEASLEKKIIYSHIPREKNSQADKYVNMALDNKA